MITGDHATTAAAIAASSDRGAALTGTEFAALSTRARAQVDGSASVARVAPEDKVRLVATLKTRGNVVADDRDASTTPPRSSAPTSVSRWGSRAPR
jgi:Ca2+-transporting ATPase